MNTQIIGCGWLGLRLGVFLHQQGHHVAGTVRNPKHTQQLIERGINASILDLSVATDHDIKKSVEEVDSMVIAFPPKLRQPSQRSYLDQLELLSKNTVGLVKNKVILISSTSIYPDEPSLMSEKDADTSHPFYHAEQHILSTFNEKAVVLRCGGLFGAGRHIVNFFEGKINLPEGNKPVNLVHVHDVVHAIHAALVTKNNHGVYNIVSDKHPLKKNVYPVIGSRLGCIPFTFSEDDTRSGKIILNETFKKTHNFSYSFPDPIDFNI